MTKLRVEKVRNFLGGVKQNTLLVNGYPVSATLTSNGLPEITVTDVGARQILESTFLNELREHFFRITFERAQDTKMETEASIRLWPDTREDDSERPYPPSACEIKLIVPLDWSSSNSWTPSEFSAAVLAVINSRATLGMTVPFAESRGFAMMPDERTGATRMYTFIHYHCPVKSLSCSFNDSVREWKVLIEEIEDQATTDLIAQQDIGSVVTQFRFHPTVAATCGQYLLYFVQFLNDLGTETESEMQVKASDVLFRVTPLEGLEALNRVRQALECYLQFPSQLDALDSITAADDPAARELRLVVQQLLARSSLADDYLLRESSAASSLMHPQGLGLRTIPISFLREVVKRLKRDR